MSQMKLDQCQTTESPFPQQSRVKIYLLKKDGNWLDHAVGYLQAVKEEQLEGKLFLRVVQLPYQSSTTSEVCEETQTKLVMFKELNTTEYKWVLNLLVNQDVKYDSQGENILTWYEAEVNEEVALSFIDGSYLKDIVHQVDGYQGRKNTTHFRFDEVEAHPVIMPSHQNLDTFQTQIQEHSELLIGEMTNNSSYFEQLATLFEEAELQEQEHTLEALFHIFRSLIYLKNENIIKLLLDDNNYLTTFGALEYHSDNKGRYKVYYRQFLTEKCKFHNIFVGLGPEILNLIQTNFRLYYLKETVMAYYLFQEDPTYNFVSQVIQQNNYSIIKDLTSKYYHQLISTLQSLPSNIQQITSFIFEFYQIFNKASSHVLVQDFKSALVLVFKQSNMLVVLNTAIHSVLQEKTYTMDNAQFICSTLIQMQVLVMNIDPQGFSDFLLLSSQTSQLFWNNAYLLLFSEQVATHPLVSDLLLVLFPPPPPGYINQIFQNQASLFKPMLIQFLQRCKSSQKLKQSSLTLYSIILMNFGNFLPVLTEEYLQLCDVVLKQLNDKTPQNKNNILTSLKLFRFLMRVDQKDVSKYLKEGGAADSFLQFRITKRHDGVLEGVLRECVQQIIKNNFLAQYLVPTDDPQRKSMLFEPLFKEFTYVSPQYISQSSLPPPASPASKINSAMVNRFPEDNAQRLYLDDHPSHFQDDNLYFDNDDEEQDRQEPSEYSPGMREKIIKVREGIRKKKQMDEESPIDFFSQKRKPQLEMSLVFHEYDQIEKKIRLNEDNIHHNDKPA